jgi:hypothetical protein
MIDFDALANKPILATFGEAVLYRPSQALPFTLQGVLDRHASRVAFDQGGTPTSVMTPQIYVRLADFPAGVAPTTKDEVEARGDIFQVVDLQPDGLGAVLLILGNRQDRPYG